MHVVGWDFVSHRQRLLENIGHISCIPIPVGNGDLGMDIISVFEASSTRVKL